MALGPLTRSVPRRLKYGGTYDQNWEDNIFPFLPPDFDERYYQQVGRGSADRTTRAREPRWYS